MDYETFFGLRERPFNNTLQPRFFFNCETFQRLLDELTADRLPRQVMLYGPQGVGKTMLLSRLPEALAGRKIQVLTVLRGGSLKGILKEALLNLGLSGRCPPEAPEETLLGYFQNAVTNLVDEGQKVVLAVDEAQLLNRETISDLEALSSLEPSWKGKVSLILAVGVYEKLPLPQGEDVLFIEALPYSAQETSQYINYRMTTAGANKLIFSSESLEALYTLSQGLPELLNNLAERSLMTAWAAGKKQVSAQHVTHAKGSLLNPLTVNPLLAERAAGKDRHLPKVPQRRPVLFIASLIVVLAIFSALIFLKPGAAKTPAETLDFRELAPNITEAAQVEPETLTPAAGPMMPHQAPNLALPSPPAALINLPRNSLALVVDGGLNMARLWQGSLKGPGLKAEIAPPDIQDPGLYLVGRPQSRTPLIFQFPPAKAIPKDASVKLWNQVETHLPQDILPLMVGEGPDLTTFVAPELKEVLSGKLSSWTQAQEFKFADTMANLYAEKFYFFEPGFSDRVINRENFRNALASELRSSGDVTLTVSEPLIMLDPRDHKRAWAVFNLIYDSKLRHDMGQRTLIFEHNRSSGDWLIVSELWIKEVTLK
jgi:general secretion pathway protein A